MTRGPRPPTRRAVALLLVALLGVACGGVAGELTVPSTPPDLSPLRSSEPDPFDPAEDRVVQVVDRVRPAVVNVTTDNLVDSGGGLQPEEGVGTGFLIREDGVIVTNCHVVEGARTITVIVPAADEDDSPERFDARVIGHDCDHDLAVLKVEGQDLPTVPLGSSGTLRLGEPVVALGYALGLEGGPTVTTGIVSALDRVITVDDPNFGPREYADVIQTDAAINPGNSGGPLVNLDGAVVGINSAGASQAENIGFAIAIDSAVPTIERALTDPEAPVGYLGVVSRTVTPDLALQLDLPVTRGAYIVAISPDGPAEGAGLEAGDVIVGFDGQDVTTSDELGELIHAHGPGDVVGVVVVRSDGSTSTVEVELALNPGPIFPAG